MDIKSIQTAEVQYSAQFGRFASNLTELRTADLIPAPLASGEKGGYKFTLTGNQKGFVINARPKTYNETGRKSFYSDETLVIRVNTANEAATANSPEFGK